MEVTRSNFTEVQTELEKVLKNALFISIDTEFTGLNAGENTNSLDTPAEYYKKVRTGALDFLLVQFGLAVFNYDTETQKFTHRAYNFYVFPRPTVRQAPDSRFLCQASSLDFLAKNNFNFNKLFLEGIPYLNQKDEQFLRERLEERRAERKILSTTPNKPENYIPIPPEFKQAVTNACDKIAEIVESNSTDEFTLDNCNGFARKLIYQEAWKRFSRDTLSLETKQGRIVARRVTPEEKERLEQEKCEKENVEIDEAVGFAHLIRMLSSSDKLIVGHNMLLDLCHVLHRFCAPLPEDYQDFKDMLHCLFPRILDTKYLCSNSEIREKVPSSVLSHILLSIAEPPFQPIKVEAEDEGCGYTLEDDKSHEAGYDAFITGVVFIKLSNYLGSLHSPPLSPVLPTSPLLKKYINKLFLMKIPDTYMNLDGSDPEVKRDHVFHITFPKRWTSHELNELFNPYGTIYITWLTDTTAYVSLHNKEFTLSATKNLVRCKKHQSGVSVLSYYSYLALTQNTSSAQVTHSNYKIQSPSIQVAKKRKLQDTQTTQYPALKRKRSVDRTSISKLNIESIPEEDESTTQPQVSNSLEENKNGSVANQAMSAEKFFQENEDWN